MSIQTPEWVNTEEGEQSPFTPPPSADRPQDDAGNLLGHATQEGSEHLLRLPHQPLCQGGQQMQTRVSKGWGANPRYTRIAMGGRETSLPRRRAQQEAPTTAQEEAPFPRTPVFMGEGSNRLGRSKASWLTEPSVDSADNKERGGRIKVQPAAAGSADTSVGGEESECAKIRAERCGGRSAFLVSGVFACLLSQVGGFRTVRRASG